MKISKCLVTLSFMAFTLNGLADDQVSNEIDATVWKLISQTVVESDIADMASVYHSDAVLVNPKGTNPIESVLARWGKGMEEMESAGSTAEVSFKFTHRQDNETTAFESGMFRYAVTDAAGVEIAEIIPFEALLVKKEGQWKILMERQLEKVDQAAWLTR